MTDSNACPSVPIPDEVEVTISTNHSAGTSISNDTSTGNLEVVTTKKKRDRTIFVITSHLNEKDIPLFLSDNNTKDLHLLRVLVLKTLWDTAHGNKIKAWDKVASMCLEQKYVSRQQIYKTGSLNHKVVKDHFHVLLKWIKNEKNTVTYRSGTDDEDPPTEIRQLIDNMLGMHTGWEVNKELTGKQKTE